MVRERAVCKPPLLGLRRAGTRGTALLMGLLFVALGATAANAPDPVAERAVVSSIAPLSTEEPAARQTAELAATPTEAALEFTPSASSAELLTPTAPAPVLTPQPTQPTPVARTAVPTFADPLPTAVPISDEMEAVEPFLAAAPYVEPNWEPAPSGKALLIDQGQQKMFVYENAKLVRVLPVSTGLPVWDSFTPSFRGVVGYYMPTIWSFGQMADHAWYLFKATGDILIHGAPYTWDAERGVRVYSDLEALGERPASHGCIRLHPRDAAWLLRWDPRGAPIEITRYPGVIDWTTGRGDP